MSKAQYSRFSWILNHSVFMQKIFKPILLRQHLVTHKNNYQLLALIAIVMSLVVSCTSVFHNANKVTQLQSSNY
ncbi:MAG: hypothetical protein ACI82S_002646, partial [Patiriisocius sp.]